MNVSKGQSQPEIVADIRLQLILEALTTTLLPRFHCGSHESRECQMYLYIPLSKREKGNIGQRHMVLGLRPLYYRVLIRIIPFVFSGGIFFFFS